MSDDNAKLLVVDDDELLLEMLRRVIENKGIPCATCPSAMDALAILRGAGNIKLVLLDINMPEMTGLELLEKIQSINPHLPVIMITGLGDMDVAEKCMTLGAKDFITKPFDLDYLETSVMSQIIPYL